MHAALNTQAKTAPVDFQMKANHLTNSAEAAGFVEAEAAKADTTEPAWYPELDAAVPSAGEV
jgi:hypothetical protein